MRPEKGVLIVLSGPSGSGKGTLVKKLLEQRDDTVLSVSVTTRQPRPSKTTLIIHCAQSNSRR